MISLSHPERFEISNGLVYKRHPERLNSDWKSKMERILGVWDLPAFVSFCDGGYVTKFIDGKDIHGSSPFERAKSDYRAEVTQAQKIKLLEIFHLAAVTGESCGFTLADINCSNILINKKDEMFMIDYDSIAEWPLPEDNFRVWSNTLNIVFEKF